MVSASQVWEAGFSRALCESVWVSVAFNTDMRRVVYTLTPVRDSHACAVTSTQRHFEELGSAAFVLRTCNHVSLITVRLHGIQSWHDVTSHTF